MAKGKASKKSPQKQASKQKSAAGSNVTTRSKSGNKKFEGKSENDELAQSLAQLGLRIRKVTADGNCFFRACSDQLFGGEQQHHALRSDVVRFMVEHESDFAVFMEDDENFESYCKRMRKDGIWAGQHEQVALTRLKGVKICVHQCGQPCWTIAPDFAEIRKDARTLHLSYHNGEHYNSVRLADDLGGQPATPILITGGQARSAKSDKSKVKISDDLQATLAEDSVDVIVPVRSSAAESLEPSSHDPGTEPKGNPPNEPVKDDPARGDKLQDVASDVRPDASSTGDVKAKVKQKQPTRNGQCPCGSKRRYKDCCLLLKRAEARRMAQQLAPTNNEPGRSIKMETIFV